MAIWSVIMAGGVGARFWPLSRRARPKQLLDLFGGGPLLKVTADRVASLTPPERQIIVTSEQLADLVAEALPDVPIANILAEPVGRNTAPAVAWAALEVAARDPEGILMVLPSDHYIRDLAAYQATCEAAVAVAREGWIVTLGIPPTHPETGYGYIRQTQEAVGAAMRVDAFREKPDLATANRYLADGGYLWNAGMFFMPAALGLAELRTHEPELTAALEAAHAAGDVAGAYLGLTKISIDYAVMERTDRCAVIPGDFGWSDVGSWRSLADFRGEGDANLERGDVVAVDSRDNVLVSDSGTVAVVGVEGLVVVHTRDATLVCKVDEAQRVREIVDAIADREDLL